MSVTSLYYIFFVVVVALLYFVFPRKYRWWILLIASVVFYLIYDIRLSIWLGITSVTVYLCVVLQGRQEERYQQLLQNTEKSDRENRKKLKKRNTQIKNTYVWIASIINIGIWIVFKFTDLIIEAVNRSFSASFSLLSLALPLGISFYTLQAISYVVDVSHNKAPVQKNYFKLLLWLSFFPQIIQGPICRYSETAEQLFTPHDFNYDRVKTGAQLILWGFFKKLVIADRAAQISITVFGNSAQYSGLVFVIAALAYTIQIYGDFSGGMDIICGVSEILGINMPQNFKRPYFSRSVPEYWRRWHITLGAWFRDYIFYPLSISKAAQKVGKKTRKWFGPKLGKMIPTYLVMAIVWTMNGIWHGAGARYAVYGFYQGFLMIIGMQTESLSLRLLNRLRINTDSFGWKLWQTVRTFALMVWGRIIFKAPSLTEAFRIMGSVFKHFNLRVLFDGTVYSLGLEKQEITILIIALMILFIISFLQERGIRIRETVQKQPVAIRWMLYYALIFSIIIFGIYGYGYKPVEFVYAKF